MHVLFDVNFTDEQWDAIENDDKCPRWDLDPPQREDYMDDHIYAIGLRSYADRLIQSKIEVK